MDPFPAWERNAHWAVFAVAFLGFGLWETWRPFRSLVLSNTRRWAVHILMAAATHGAGLLMPVSAAAVALAAQKNPFGLLNQTWLPAPAQWIAAIFALDLVRWCQHFAFHRVGWLWRIHRVHHSDADIDFTTTFRFHPFEAILTQGSYLAILYVLAPPPLAAAGIELVLMAQSFFGHANVEMPRTLESRLRRWLITPGVHRIHHSERPEEQNRNFGTMFPWWDRWFGTYREHPHAADPKTMRLGLEYCDAARSADLIAMLALPFRADPDANPPERAPFDEAYILPKNR